MKTIMLSVIIPVYNERKTILQLLNKVDAVKIPGIKKEIIIVDDRSLDGTSILLKKLEKTAKYRIFFHKKNLGKGAALRTGFKKARGDILIIQDADLEYDPNDYKKLIKPILNNETDVVYGSRFNHPKFKPAHRLFYLGNIFLSLMTRLLYFRKITDMETCYKMFRKSALKGINIKAKGFDFEPEITAKFIKKGYKIKEIPVWYKGRPPKEGKKLKPFKDGIKALYYLIYYRFYD